MGRGGGGEDGRPLDEATGTVTVVGGLGGCVDPTATGPYGGSRVEKRRRKQGGKPRTGSATGASTVEKDRYARVRVQH
jgi:hypothetical protein